MFPDHTLPFGIRIATAMEVEEETQPKLLGSTPTPYRPTWEALATEEVSDAGTGPIHHPHASCSPSPWQTQPWAQGDSPTPEHPTAIVSREGVHRAWAGSSRCSSCNAEAPPCPSVTFQDCKTETSSTGVVRLGRSPLQETTPSSSAPGFRDLFP